MRLKIIGTLIVVFWGMMMGLLLKRELPSKVRVRRGYRALPAKTFSERHTKMGIYMGDMRVGFTETHINKQPDDTYRIRNVVQIEHGALRVGRMTLTIFLRPDKSLESFRLSVPAFNVALHGDVQEEGLKLTTVAGEVQTVRRIPFSQDMIVSSSLSPLSVLPALRVGKAWTIGLWNPITLEMQPVNVDVRHREKLNWKGTMVDTYVVYVTQRNLELKAWVTADGEILQEQIPFGFMLKREET